MYLYDLRQELNRKFQRLYHSDWRSIQNHLLLFLKFLRENPVIASILAELDERKLEFKDLTLEQMDSRKPLDMQKDETTYASFCLWVLEECNRKPDGVQNLGFELSFERNVDDAVRYVNNLFTKNLVDYINGKLESGDLILYLLAKFKVKCE